ncbi:hypothetical protein NLJ89_g9994 [Agrocybe chaxingu]|uniref:NADP-dependent oxidoreductase domain-containing protein n=1 Tax=Agrocybe chaxingu TaxID=84603 RepID=A0A9W8JS64_9AGAR|nr:hypothetical protein NLJ89_g9994 [Agrocybe chaxingu]
MNGAELKVKLNTGAYIPMVGTHTIRVPWKLSINIEDGQNGYRHIDTAFMYGTEKAVGQAIRDSGIPREEIFVTTKFPVTHHGRVKESFEESFANLDIGYIDLYLTHWPGALEYVEGVLMPKNADGTFRTTESVNFNQSWTEMEKLLETGKVKAIGVSNFSIKTLEELFKTAKITPAVNQVEMHPYLARNELRHYCAKHDIVIEAYTPSGRSVVREDPLIVSLAKKYGVTPTQIILAWHISRGNVFVAKSENDERQKENITIPVISEEDLGKIWHLDRGMGVCPIPTSKPGEALGWTYERLGWEDFHPKV